METDTEEAGSLLGRASVQVPQKAQPTLHTVYKFRISLSLENPTAHNYEADLVLKGTKDTCKGEHGISLLFSGVPSSGLANLSIWAGPRAKVSFSNTALSLLPCNDSTCFKNWVKFGCSVPTFLKWRLERDKSCCSQAAFKQPAGNKELLACTKVSRCTSHLDPSYSTDRAQRQILFVLAGKTGKGTGN